MRHRNFRNDAPMSYPVDERSRFRLLYVPDEFAVAIGTIPMERPAVTARNRFHIDLVELPPASPTLAVHAIESKSTEYVAGE